MRLTPLIAVMVSLLTALPAASEDAVGRVNVAGYKARSMCSGTLIRPDLVLTAAHCVARPENGQALPIRDMVFVAGWDGGDHAGAARAKSVAVHPDAFTTGRLDLRHDLALVELQERLPVAPIPVGKAALSQPMTLMGYRRSRPHKLSVETGCVGRKAASMIRVACAVEKGQSGGPAVVGQGASRRVVAVLVAKGPGGTLAVPIDDWVQQMVSLLE